MNTQRHKTHLIACTRLDQMAWYHMPSGMSWDLRVSEQLVYALGVNLEIAMATCKKKIMVLEFFFI